MIIAFNSLSLAFTSVSLSMVARDNFNLSRDKLKLLRGNFELSPETQQQRGKRNIAFRDTVPALSVYFKRRFNEKMESYTKPTVTSLELKYERLTQGFTLVWMSGLSPLAFSRVNL